ncbi:MAG: rod shape-determining protein RodA [Rhodospirillales bacterium]|nr:rod shape-determining protein RodA [Rhodospirillales bacterium]
MSLLSSHGSEPDRRLGQKLLQVNWVLVLLLSLLTGVGLLMLYSAAGGHAEPWAVRQSMRYGFALLALLTIAAIDIRFWFRMAYPIYAVSLALLAAVEVAGSSGMGAQRWIDLKIFQLQPSEIMKVALVLALARYFHSLTGDALGRPARLVVPLVLVLVPTGLVLKQPDLGTAGMLLAAGGAVFFCAGVRYWMFAAMLILAAAAVPVAWDMLHDYQQARILIFLDPESDPLDSGYHILQSKIALGSGGLWGQGFMQGTQSHLSFLPEKQTDFIFTMLAEELGLVSALGLLLLYALVLAYGFAIALSVRSQFARLLVLGITANLFLYVFVNIAMVTGLIPVVGVPLPLISYGGTAMLAVMISYGLAISAYVHREVKIARRGPGDA